jgi:hypothetical protein
MKYFTVHSVCEDLFKLELNDYILTFDDGLFSQYFYWEYIHRIAPNSILFIPTRAIMLSNFIRPRYYGEFIKFRDCFQAMRRWKQCNLHDDYMTLGEIKFLIENYNVRIGGHGHRHLEPMLYKDSLVDSIKIMKEDIDQMFNWFKIHLSITPTEFCFPFNKEDSYLKRILEDKGITQFYGKERTEIETLCLNQ